ncbi:helix-turn-helix domain-containing protein [Bacillus sp. SD088]|uniref:helix-turn-helix domain-containing protein n=1 Tax=Bacillus sp. SD088 TaxID=2782012 RepID=UPI001A975337|nr:helix-turn-helix domain-containing protein [Bacillus sp. SD088]MBO0994041.1 AraC family transcriptional regulator [Bacillus sp. SD088]
MKKSRYYKKLFIFSLLLSTIPVIILGVLSYYKAASEIEEKVAKENMQVLQQTKMSLEYHLESLDNNVTQFILSPLFTSNYERRLTSKDFVTYRDLLAAMKRFQTNKLWSDEIELINFRENWVITKAGLNYPSETGYFRKYSSVKEIPNSSTWMTISQDNVESVNLVKKLPLLTNEPKGLIRISIPKKEISKLMNRNKNIENFFVLDSDYQLISESRSWNHLLTSDKLINELRRKEMENGYFTLKINDEHVGVNFSKSSYNYWTYLSIVPIRAITKNSKDIGWYTAIVCGIILLATIIAVSLSSRHLYQPILHMYQSVVSHEGSKNILNLKDEFISIRNGISQFQDQIETQREHLKEFFVLGLFMGQLKVEKINEMVEDLEFNTDWQSLAVLVIENDMLGKAKYKEADNELILYSIKNLISKSVPIGVRFPPVVLNDYQVNIIQIHEKNPKDHNKYLYSLAEEIHRLVQNYHELNIRIGISRPYRNLANTEYAYNEATEALRFYQKIEPRTIINIDDVVLVHTEKSIFPKQVCQELIDSIKGAHTEEAERSINEFMVTVTKYNISFQQYQNIMVQLLSKLLELVEELNETSEALFGNKLLFEEILRHKNIDEVRSWFTKTILPPILEKYAEKQRSAQINITVSVISIIEKEFTSNLTLEMIAAKINFHPSYISRVFKKATGLSFSEYLLKFRVKKMKQMLRETDLKISEIAEIFHFNSSASFIRSFRKVEGMTPGQYRKKYHS